MKKLILTILTTITILGVNAQGNNLQFNRALYENYVANGVNVNVPEVLNSSFTVPANKVWKITSANAQGDSYGAVFYISKSGLNSFNRSNDFPIWLPEGIYDMKVSSSATSSGNTLDDIYIVISGIEFNIVP